MSVEPSPGKPGLSVRIIKQDDPNFGESPLVKRGGAAAAAPPEIRQGYAIGVDFKPIYGMPSGPGFEAGDPAIALAGGRKRKTRTYPRGILRKTIRGTRTPTKSPPTRKRAVLLVPETKIKQARKTVKQRAAKTDLGTIRRKLVEKKILSPDRKHVPPAILRKLYADAVGAGLME